MRRVLPETVSVAPPAEEPTADPFPQAASAGKQFADYLARPHGAETPAQEPVSAVQGAAGSRSSAEAAPTPAKPRRAAMGPERKRTLGQIRRQEAVDRAREYLRPRPGQQTAWAEETKEGGADGSPA